MNRLTDWITSWVTGWSMDWLAISTIPLLVKYLSFARSPSVQRSVAFFLPLPFLSVSLTIIYRVHIGRWTGVQRLRQEGRERKTSNTHTGSKEAIQLKKIQRSLAIVTGWHNTDQKTSRRQSKRKQKQKKRKLRATNTAVDSSCGHSISIDHTTSNMLHNDKLKVLTMTQTAHC